MLNVRGFGFISQIYSLSATLISSIILPNSTTKRIFVKRGATGVITPNRDKIDKLYMSGRRECVCIEQTYFNEDKK